MIQKLNYRSGKNVLFSHIPLLWQLLVTQLWNAPLGFIPFSTLKKCNGCLTFTCAVFKRCPRHYYQTLYRVISFHIAVSVPPEWSAGEPAIDPTPLKKKPLLRLVKSCPVRSCLKCKLHTSCLICFSFLSPKYGRWHLGEGLFFPMIKQHMNLYGFGVVYLTRMEMHTFVLMLHSSYKQGSCFSL